MVDLQFSDPALAALYDDVCPRARRLDFDFYLPLALKAGSVLDLGCGTGAFLHEVRETGHAGRLCGLDPAAGMIAQARRHAGIEWRQGDIVSAGFREAFDLVIMTGHAFQVLVEDHQLSATLAAVHAALVMGGRFAFETRNPKARAWESWTEASMAKVADSEGRPINVACEVTAPFDGRTVSFIQTYTSPGWPEARISPSTLRFLDVETLAALLAEAGFAIEAQFGDWDRAPLTDGSPEVIVLARRS